MYIVDVVTCKGLLLVVLPLRMMEVGLGREGGGEKICIDVTINVHVFCAKIGIVKQVTRVKVTLYSPTSIIRTSII